MVVVGNVAILSKRPNENFELRVQIVNADAEWWPRYPMSLSF